MVLHFLFANNFFADSVLSHKSGIFGNLSQKKTQNCPPKNTVWAKTAAQGEKPPPKILRKNRQKPLAKILRKISRPPKCVIIFIFGDNFMDAKLDADGNELRAILTESGRMLQEIRGFL